MLRVPILGDPESTLMQLHEGSNGMVIRLGWREISLIQPARPSPDARLRGESRRRGRRLLRAKNQGGIHTAQLGQRSMPRLDAFLVKALEAETAILSAEK